MTDAFTQLASYFEKHSPVVVDGQSYVIWLINLQPLSDLDAVNVVFGARLENTTHTPTLRLNAARLNNPQEVLELVVSTVQRIERGLLPPGARDLL